MGSLPTNGGPTTLKFEEMRIETKRLILRVPREEDIEAITEVANDWRIAEMTLVPHPYTTADGLFFVRKSTASWAEHGMGGMVVVHREDHKIIGAIGLRPLELPDHGSSGFWFSPAVWGKGFATEALSAILHFGFSERGMRHIEASHLKINPASGRVMEKAGLSGAVDVELPARDGEGLVPGVTRSIGLDDWKLLLRQPK